MKVFMVRKQDALVPVDNDQYEAFDVIDNGKEVLVEIKSPRNPGQHRLYFQLLATLVKYHPSITETKDMLESMKLLTGHYEWRVHPVTGEQYPRTLSISFASMGQEKFQHFWNKSMQAIHGELLDRMGLSGVRTQHLLSELDQLS